MFPLLISALAVAVINLKFSARVAVYKVQAKFVVPELVFLSVHEELHETQSTKKG